MIHHPSSTRNGIQNSANWMLRSIARAFASSCGSIVRLPRRWFTTRFAKKTSATQPSAEKETMGRRMRPNHLWVVVVSVRKRRERDEDALFLDAA